MRAIAAPTLPESYVAALDGFAVGPQGGSCGAAVTEQAFWKAVTNFFTTHIAEAVQLPTSLLSDECHQALLRSKADRDGSCLGRNRITHGWSAIRKLARNGVRGHVPF
jgi:hypothetical protein